MSEQTAPIVITGGDDKFTIFSALMNRGTNHLGYSGGIDVWFDLSCESASELEVQSCVAQFYLNGIKATGASSDGDSWQLHLILGVCYDLRIRDIAPLDRATGPDLRLLRHRITWLRNWQFDGECVADYNTALRQGVLRPLSRQ